MQFQSTPSPSGWNEMQPSQATPSPKALAVKERWKKVINEENWSRALLCSWRETLSLKLLHCWCFYVPSGVWVKSASIISTSKWAAVSLLSTKNLAILTSSVLNVSADRWPARVQIYHDQLSHASLILVVKAFNQGPLQTHFRHPLSHAQHIT